MIMTTNSDRGKYRRYDSILKENKEILITYRFDFLINSTQICLKNIFLRYHRALSNKGLNVLLPPYIDRWGAGTVITITKAISIG